MKQVVLFFIQWKNRQRNVCSVLPLLLSSASFSSWRPMTGLRGYRCFSPHSVTQTTPWRSLHFILFSMYYSLKSFLLQSFILQFHTTCTCIQICLLWLAEVESWRPSTFELDVLITPSVRISVTVVINVSHLTNNNR